jgi:hypothetical protein
MDATIRSGVIGLADTRDEICLVIRGSAAQ